MNICILDGKKINDKETLHDVLAEGLKLPDWYGRNLDALYDSLSDLQEETEIRFLHIRDLEGHLGKYAEKLEKVIHMAGKENSKIKITEPEENMEYSSL